MYVCMRVYMCVCMYMGVCLSLTITRPLKRTHKLSLLCLKAVVPLAERGIATQEGRRRNCSKCFKVKLFLGTGEKSVDVMETFSVNHLKAVGKTLIGGT